MFDVIKIDQICNNVSYSSMSYIAVLCIILSLLGLYVIDVTCYCYGNVLDIALCGDN